MRNELELMETIERYLANQLTAEEKLAFERQLESDPAIREELQLQQELMEGIDRSILQQKVKAAKRRYNRGRYLRRSGFGAALLLIIAAAVLIYQQTSHRFSEGNSIPSGYSGMETPVISDTGFSLPAINEEQKPVWANADHYLPAQRFSLDVSSDTVIETNAGIVLSIPANGFVDEDGDAVNGDVELVVKEALDPATIMRSGLSTRSGNELLETGGMFFIDARKNGEPVKIDPARVIYINVPADTIKPGMQLFSGNRLDDGSIDWTNPRPLQHWLTPLDIHSLDFYPPDYLDVLKSWGLNAADKSFTDSLYFSLASLFDSTEENRARTEEITNSTDTSIGDSQHYYYHPPCGINPASVKAIWSNRYQNTLLATREFEQRMEWIHRSAQQSILDLYIDNLDKDLSYIDSLAAAQLAGKPLIRDQFLSFAARHDGNVRNDDKQIEKLKEYYRRKSAAFTEAIAKTQRAYWNNEEELDRQYKKKKGVFTADSIDRANQNFRDEFNLNLESAWKQLGYEKIPVPATWPTNTYNVQITNTGWFNVDKYVMESLESRTSLDYTDPQTGKKATIDYKPASFQIEEASGFDRLYVYLVPDKLSSFMQVNGSQGIYTEKLNELMSYQLVCIGYKKQQAFFYSLDKVSSKEYTNIILKPVSNKELDRALNRIGNDRQSDQLKKQTRFFQLEIREERRIELNRYKKEIRDELQRIFFPCYPDKVQTAVITESLK